MNRREFLRTAAAALGIAALPAASTEIAPRLDFGGYEVIYDDGAEVAVDLLPDARTVVPLGTTTERFTESEIGELFFDGTDGQIKYLNSLGNIVSLTRNA